MAWVEKLRQNCRRACPEREQAGGQAYKARLSQWSESRAVSKEPEIFSPHLVNLV